MSDKIIYRLPRKTFDGDKEITLNGLEEYFVKKDSGLKYKIGELKPGELVFGRLKKEKDIFSVLKPSLTDIIKRYKRGAQVMTVKDAAPIITKTGLNKEQVVLDAGTGSGSLATFLANMAKEVHTCDVREDHVKIAKKNIKLSGLENIKFLEKDVTQEDSFSEEEYDLFTLDIPEPWNALKTASKVLKRGGYLVIYSPHITQIQKSVVNLPSDLHVLETIEVIERSWKVGKDVLRPETKDHSHTGFLSFIRKL